MTKDEDDTTAKDNFKKATTDEAMVKQGTVRIGTSSFARMTENDDMQIALRAFLLRH